MEMSKEEQYQEYVKQVTPGKNLPLQMLKAFLAGGVICVLGQGILEWLSYLGLDQKTAGSWCSIILVALSAILTGLGVYATITKWGGAGCLVPITGFANGVCSSACEFQVEGQVFGIGCQIFKIAGPVILYGIFSSWCVGLIYWILKVFGVV